MSNHQALADSAFQERAARPQGAGRMPLAAIVSTVIALCFGAAAHADSALSERVSQAIVRVEATVPADARTADSLGTTREGTGVAIDSAGLILTIGYVVLEADSVTVTDHADRQWPAEIVAYDHESGFGLLRAGGEFQARPIDMGSTRTISDEADVLVAAYGNVRPARVADRRQFAGYWEYLLDEAVFTYPPHPEFAGAALIDQGGRLIGIGSLIVRDAAAPTDRRMLPGNMFIPIDALTEPFPDLLTDGRRAGPYRPWIGLYTEAVRDRLFVTRLAEGGPADDAGIRKDDLVVGVGGKPVHSLAELYRTMWNLGDAGVTIPVTVLRGMELLTLDVPSMDRYRWLKLGRSY